jgi:hypothetical protein
MRIALVLAAVAFSLLAQSSAAATRATLRLLDDTSPVTLRGAGFHSREHVRVVIVNGSARTVKKVVATALGRFSVRVQGDVNACVGFSATAVGSDGTRASFKRAPGQCPAP